SVCPHPVLVLVSTSKRPPKSQRATRLAPCSPGMRPAMRNSVGTMDLSPDVADGQHDTADVPGSCWMARYRRKTVGRLIIAARPDREVISPRSGGVSRRRYSR